MSGPNVVLKKGQRLFGEGEPSDGMYLIRKGEVLVYLEKGGNEVKLATLSAGAMLGEMSLFDKKPRSASAKAIADSEVTKITNDDFAKLMKQIPKWFVGIMTALSSRLRETNERLQALDTKNKAKTNPLSTFIKVMNILNLLFHKDGTKEDKVWSMERESSEAVISTILDMEPAMTSRAIQALVDGRLLSMKKNTYKKDILMIGNRGNLEKFIEFVREFMTQYPDQTGVPDEAVQMLECLNKVAQESAYDSATVTVDQVIEEGLRKGMDGTKFHAQLTFFKNPTKVLTLTKMDGGKIGFKVDKKALPRLLETYATLAALKKSGVT